MSEENINPVGEGISEFAKGGKKGVFSCGNCVHMENGVCKHPVMRADSDLPRNKDGYPKVDHSDCCKYVRRPGDE